MFISSGRGSSWSDLFQSYTLFKGSNFFQFLDRSFDGLEHSLHTMTRSPGTWKSLHTDSNGTTVSSPWKVCLMPKHKMPILCNENLRQPSSLAALWIFHHRGWTLSLLPSRLAAPRFKQTNKQTLLNWKQENWAKFVREPGVKWHFLYNHQKSKKCTFKFRDKCALAKHLENHVGED